MRLASVCPLDCPWPLNPATELVGVFTNGLVGLGLGLAVGVFTNGLVGLPLTGVLANNGTLGLGLGVDGAGTVGVVIGTGTGVGTGT